MNNNNEDDQSMRAWSTQNSLFSGDTNATAATQASTSSTRKLAMVQELQSSENTRAPAQTYNPSSLDRTTGHIATTQTVPLPASAPLARAATTSPRTARQPPPPSTASAGLFGSPNMQIPVTQQEPISPQAPAGRASSIRSDASDSTLNALQELELALTRLYDSVTGASRPSTLVTRAASAAQLVEDYAQRVSPGGANTHNCESLVRIIRTVLAFTDCLLRSSNLRSTRMSLLRSLEMLGIRLGLVSQDPNVPIRLPRNFGLHNTMFMDLCDSLMKEMSNTPISEQEGAYIAPVCRGLSPNFSVATLCIGIPHLSDYHWQQVISLHSICPELHFYARRDCILPAQQQQQQQQRSPRVLPPFRTPDPSRPPMSVSLAPELSIHTSGTLGGYIYPVIEEGDTKHAEFRNCTFALTCGHVCLADADASRNIDKPVLVPSPVLVSLFRKALDVESKLHSSHSFEHHAYRQAMSELDINPPKSLGVLVWGERDVVASKGGQHMSDLAIIRCDPAITCRNDLGDDIDLTQDDLGLAFERNVTHVVPRELTPGLQVFKYGATSKYTSGLISSSRIIYWSNNKLQSTEFVVRSESSMFASGGDSGAWVLARSTHTGSSGLGVVGMIHSYDGELKEFGLFTPMTSILDRLQQVTSVPWAVVGVPGEGEVDTYGSA